MTLALVERFRSVQGEGRNAGRAAIFVRFAGCNLDCVFADGAVCDTPWRRAREKVSVPELVRWAASRYPRELRAPAVWTADGRAAARENAPMAVLTGGEPTIAPDFDIVAHAMVALGYYVAVETNGTTWRDGLALADWIACSPKTATAHARDVDPELHPRVVEEADEWRWVLAADSPDPPWLSDALHYASPAMLSDGSGAIEDAPRFAPGAVDRCLDLVARDPRWRLSLQRHKWIGVR